MCFVQLISHRFFTTEYDGACVLLSFAFGYHGIVRFQAYVEENTIRWPIERNLKKDAESFLTLSYLLRSRHRTVTDRNERGPSKAPKRLISTEY